jgi:hypothetical protein
MSLPFTLRIKDKSGTRMMRVATGMAKMEVLTTSEEDYIGTVVITDLRVSLLVDKADLLATLDLSIIDIVCDADYNWTATDDSGNSYKGDLGTFFLAGSGGKFLIKQ